MVGWRHGSAHGVPAQSRSLGGLGPRHADHEFLCSTHAGLEPASNTWIRASDFELFARHEGNAWEFERRGGRVNHRPGCWR